MKNLRCFICNKKLRGFGLWEIIKHPLTNPVSYAIIRLWSPDGVEAMVPINLCDDDFKTASNPATQGIFVALAQSKMEALIKANDNKPD